MPEKKNESSVVVGTELLAALPVAVYTTDAEGLITFYNDTAAAFWGCCPELGRARWCGSWRLFWPDGRPMPHDQCPMAVMLKEGRVIRGVEAVAERPDGTRVTFMPSPTPLRDAAGRLIGGINLLVDITERKQAEIAAAKLAAIVSSSDDAIVSKTLDGVITSWNAGATRIFGYQPEEMVGQSIRKIIPAELQSEEDEILRRLRNGERIDHFETVRLAKDGRRLDLSITVSPLRDGSGFLVGASKVARDISGRKQAEAAAARLAAIVSSSDDAIISKNLDGIITTWNGGATRIFGYEADEMIGRSIRRIIPAELQQEEDEILAKLRRGERIDHFDTVRLTKTGARINVSLTISPMHDGAGRVIGASKVARDVTERKRNEELQRLLFEELNHRVKNTLAMIQALASQSMRAAASPAEFVKSFSGRVQALARAHDLLVRQRMKGASVEELVREQVVLGGGESRVRYSGPDIMLDPRTAVQLALVLHELATNARKYGALSVSGGALSVTWHTHLHHGGSDMQLRWQESGVPNVTAPRSRGFGTTLIERSLEAQEGEASLSFGQDGLTCDIRLPLPKEARHALSAATAGERDEFWTRAAPAAERAGKRVLLVEDEPLVAMQIEEELISRGFEVVGPASTVQGAKRLIAQARFDAALLDANLGGHSVGELAAALAQKGIPFAFATGYGRDALPAAFRDAVIMSKPFEANQLIAVVGDLLDRGRHSAAVVSLRVKRD